MPEWSDKVCLVGAKLHKHFTDKKKQFINLNEIGLCMKNSRIKFALFVNLILMLALKSIVSLDLQVKVKVKMHFLL